MEEWRTESRIKQVGAVVKLFHAGTITLNECRGFIYRILNLDSSIDVDRIIFAETEILPDAITEQKRKIIL